jgi:hypothetical protein
MIQIKMILNKTKRTPMPLLKSFAFVNLNIELIETQQRYLYI